jgi:hypothetical protein
VKIKKVKSFFVSNVFFASYRLNAYTKSPKKGNYIKKRTLHQLQKKRRNPLTLIMTIDSGWVRVMKEEAPEVRNILALVSFDQCFLILFLEQAFRSTYPFKGTPGVAYIDGMPLLMISEKTVRSWDDLLRNNYARHIQRYYKLGCHTVVLAFDDYERVPASKAITQANRSKKKAAYEFGEGQQLPPTIPHGYNEKLSNRIFKRRVIDMVSTLKQCLLGYRTDMFTHFRSATAWRAPLC